MGSHRFKYGLPNGKVRVDIKMQCPLDTHYLKQVGVLLECIERIAQKNDEQEDYITEHWMFRE